MKKALQISLQGSFFTGRNRVAGLTQTPRGLEGVTVSCRLPFVRPRTSTYASGKVFRFLIILN